MLEIGLLKVNDFAAMALGAAVLAHHPADEAFRSPVTLLQGHNGPAATFRAQKFPSARSYCFAKALQARACGSSARVCAWAFHGRGPGPVWPDENSHSPWTRFWGPRQRGSTRG